LTSSRRLGRCRSYRSPVRSGSRSPISQPRARRGSRRADHTTRFFTSALDTEAIVDFATIAGVELLRIDERTTIRDFRNELNWNQAYYRLAQGF